jgi:hypothetical protein
MKFDIVGFFFFENPSRDFMLYYSALHENLHIFMTVKGKAIPLQPLTGPERSRRLRLPDIKTIGT